MRLLLQSGGRPLAQLSMASLVAQAESLRTAGDVKAAIAALHRATGLDPAAPEPLLQLGILLLEAGRPGEALPCFDRAVSLRPDMAQAQFRRGVALDQLGYFAEAAKAYQQAIAAAPRLAEAHMRLGMVRLVQEQKEAAAEAFSQAAALGRKRSQGRFAEACAHRARRAAPQAITTLRRLVALEPRHAAAQAQLGELLAEAGHGAEAWTAFETALQLDPRGAGRYYDLVRIRSLTNADRPLLDRMLAAEQRRDLHPIHRVLLLLAIGKAWDDLGDPEQAMRYFLSASALKTSIRPLDRAALLGRVDWQIRTFTPDLFARRQAAPPGVPIPLLVLGMPRSGTTLVESVLGAHRQIGSGEELPFWRREGPRLMAPDAQSPETVVQGLAAAYRAVLRGLSEAPYVTDKKPDNFVWAGLIHLAIPEARIIHCRRNPLDTAVSIVGNFFAPRPDFSTDSGDLVFYWRQYERLMTHWRAVLPADRFLDLSYEGLVSEPEPTIRSLLAFCGLDWDPACLHPEHSTRTVSTASLWQVRQPISPRSVGRWRRYAPWLGVLRELAENTVLQPMAAACPDPDDIAQKLDAAGADQRRRPEAAD